MADEDWDNEVGTSTAPSFFPNKNIMDNFGKKDDFKSTAFTAGGFSSYGQPFKPQGAAFHRMQSYNDGWCTSVAQQQHQDGNENSSWNNNNEKSSGFGRRGGFGNQRGADYENGGVSFGNRGGGFRGGSSFESGGGRGREGGRGFGRGRGGFRQDNGDNDFGSSGGFGGRRGGFGSRSGDDNGEGRGRFGRGGSRGGYKGRDEEVLSSEKAPYRSDREDEGGENAGPKVIYVPPPPPEEEDTIFAHYETGINFNKYDDILVDVSGNAPLAIMAFHEAGLCDTLNKNISKSGYVKPTPVQKHGIPIVLGGCDLMACAQTGSGKTAAFLLPILQQLMKDGVAASKFSELQEPEAIIVAPTRELINQIYLEARKFAYGTCVRPVVVYGGISTGYTIREVLKGCNVLCGTPGRLMDIIGRGKVGLSKLRYLVLDEADRMLDMGFEPEMRRLVASPGMPPKEERQTLLFSATYPEDIQKLAADFLKPGYIFLAVGQVGGACSDVEQNVLQVTQYSKRDKLVEMLQTTGTERTMVFVETKRKADFIATFLCQEKIPTTSIHGDREQREREQALGDFRTGKCPVLVATSVAARGLDIEHVQHVVNFDLPSSIEEYVHRIGRTGRCGNTGKAISFFDPESDTPIARSLVKVLSDAKQEVPAWLEEVAFSAHGTTGFNPRGNVFASVDSRKGPGGNRSFGNRESSQPAIAVDEDAWE
ncbi:putative ATP-dependent RNA helicase DDX4 isoform X2 [Acipenser oxyrinchus oxyrinchus]|uniref:RNA helicase n=1 Tax=Acipenser oxyrinchus oxyrinchus TaxID=40147 RepID=A0AAD8GM06_ACIOX|nr:putative ATP-dependent RNA helicase DDX4 isoform X2 [Acipenser oxyrinchus oxyrinchus]